VGDVERLAGKRVRKLYITLPNNYADWLFIYTHNYKIKDGIFYINKIKTCKLSYCCCC
jgi:hypothetical protein